MLKKALNNKITDIFNNEKGFSLVEMLIVVLIIAIIASLITTVYITSAKSQKDIINKAGSESNMRTALYTMTKDIREATDIISAKSDYLKIKSNVNNDSIDEVVEYILTSSNGVYILNKKINGGSDIFIMDFITSNNVFSYYANISGSALQVPLSSQSLSSFKLIKISFIVNREPSNTIKAVNLSTVVSLRNLRNRK